VTVLTDLAARPVIGHRGAALYAPENTLESFQLALAQGADALEFDVRAAADGEAMVIHDPTLDRTTDLSGPVAGRTRAELSRADAGYRFQPAGGGSWPWRGRGVRIPTLREVLRQLPEVPLLIEIKEVGVQRDVALALLETGAAARAVVAGDDWRALDVFQAPPFTAGASKRDIARLYFGGLVGLAPPALVCRSLAVPERFKGLPVPTGRFVRQAHARGASVHVWTVDDAGTATTLWRRGVNGIVTNAPDRICAARAAAGG
jgi:glycerophosphoryl diester phosphodiesterase